MTCIDINVRLYFDGIVVDATPINNKGCEDAISELFDDIFGTTEEYEKTEVKIKDIKEVD